MIRRLFDEIYGGCPAEFVAPGSPEDAVRLLADATPRTSLSSLFADAIVGAVTVDRVVLRRHHVFFHNGFAPQFRGHFTLESGRTVLHGRFELHPLAKAFMTTWFGCVGFFSTFSLVIAPGIAVEKGVPWLAGLLVGLGFAAAGLLLGFLGLGFVRFCKRLAMTDAEFIRDHIESTLRAPAG